MAGHGRHGTIKAALGRATRAAATGTRATGRLAARGGALAARGATTAWKATALLRAAAARQLALAATTTARHARRAPAGLLHAALATTAGLLTALWKRSPSAGYRRLIDVWKRLRARSAAKAKTHTPDTPGTVAPPVADSVRQPTHPT
ncbi:hypothetical protein, partial [Streptomyces sp. NRRL WC-3719]|uniref:hypothetical protein n=1 Tax=Streptomyces sp. NRRL WC-3719 TaxID=1463932 RepID=UPI0004CD9230